MLNQCREALLDSVVGNQHGIFGVRDGMLPANVPRLVRLVACTKQCDCVETANQEASLASFLAGLFGESIRSMSHSNRSRGA